MNMNQIRIMMASLSIMTILEPAFASQLHQILPHNHPAPQEISDSFAASYPMHCRLKKPGPLQNMPRNHRIHALKPLYLLVIWILDLFRISLHPRSLPLTPIRGAAIPALRSQRQFVSIRVYPPYVGRSDSWLQ